MPEVGPAGESQAGTDENPVASEIVFLSSDVIKSDEFNPEDHVILVVPESSEHLVTDGENGTSYIIPSAEDAEVCEGLNDVDSDRLRETIKSNFLVIAKLLPSKSPPPLVPIVTSKLDGELLKIEEESSDVSDVPVLQRLPPAPEPVIPKTPVKTRAPRTPRSPGAKNHAVKQEGPEIFGKMFPASYNDVMYKQIREIIFFKCGKDATEETEVSEGINCPHCRKKPLSLVLLKEHLANCHTYPLTKRKNVSPSSKTNTKKKLFRCQYCDEAFVSQARKDRHDCSLAVERVKDAITTTTITCGICHQDFGSLSELKSHRKEEMRKLAADGKQPKTAADVKTATVPATGAPKTYVLCPVCHKRVSSSLKEEHLKKHRDLSECVRCSETAVLNEDGVCPKCTDRPATAICPNCDLEVDVALFHEHVLTHSGDLVTDDITVEPPSLTVVRIVSCSSCQDEFKIPADGDEIVDKCKKCQKLS